MTTARALSAFQNFPVIAGVTTLSRPHWFFGPRHGFGFGGIVIILLAILLVFFVVSLLTGEGKSQ